jgi:hypothetical protein
MEGSMAKSHDDKKRYYETIKCCDLKQFLSKIEDKTNNGWMFRGQVNESSELQHSFERACNRFNISGERRINIETNMIREFKRRLHHYTANTPSKYATDEWLALMQHHGAPTRLLDFTYSPYVAAYFAFEHAKANSNVAVWAVDYRWFSERLERRKDISKRMKRKYNEYAYSREEHERNFDYIFRRKTPKKLVLSVNPFRLNERLAYQRGVFLCPGDISVSLMDNLSAYEGYADLNQHIVKYVMPTGSANEKTINTLESLDSMNISRITLFPGLDGFAQSFEPRIKSLFDKQ